jgi:hypothetical protein
VVESLGITGSVSALAESFAGASLPASCAAAEPRPRVHRSNRQELMRASKEREFCKGDGFLLNVLAMLFSV